jgi:hypothetical protein
VVAESPERLRPWRSNSADSLSTKAFCFTGPSRPTWKSSTLATEIIHKPRWIRSSTIASVRMSPVVCTTTFTPPCAAYLSRRPSMTLYVTRSRTGSSSDSPPERITRPVFSGNAPSGCGSSRSR